MNRHGDRQDSANPHNHLQHSLPGNPPEPTAITMNRQGTWFDPPAIYVEEAWGDSEIIDTVNKHRETVITNFEDLLDYPGIGSIIGDLGTFGNELSKSDVSLMDKLTSASGCYKAVTKTWAGDKMKAIRNASENSEIVNTINTSLNQAKTYIDNTMDQLSKNDTTTAVAASVADTGTVEPPRRPPGQRRRENPWAAELQRLRASGDWKGSRVSNLGRWKEEEEPE
ncbi:hypothetical protein L204_105877 [Cryptococcus depauperatus]